MEKDKNKYALGIVGLLVLAAFALQYYGPNAGTGMASTKCTDWDEGFNPVYLGTCVDSAHNAYADTCVSAESVKEYYCLDDTTCTSQIVHCEYGCVDGACK
jgi:hypothetical protein